MKDIEITYNWFLTKQNAGARVEKDDFLCDRVMWDGLQKDLDDNGLYFDHDAVKRLVRKVDKGGWLGGVTEGRTFEEQKAFFDEREQNREETGHPRGADGVIEDIDSYAKAMSEELAIYESTTHWAKTSEDYKNKIGWRCELCLRQHRPNSSSLVTHHRSYKLETGECALYRETSRELMAVCADVCHPLADIARYIRAGRIQREDFNAATEPLLQSVRS